MTDIAGERAALKAQGLDIIGREQWAATQSYSSPRDVTMPARGFVLHISVTQDPDDLAGREDDSMRVIERIGQERFGIGFPYNAAAFDTGRLYEGQPLTRRGAHTVNTRGIAGFPRDMNFAWRALCLPQMVADQVTDVQIDAAARWAAAQIRAGLAAPGASWSGHRDYATKDCPGTNGYARIPELNALTRRYEANGLGPQEDPMARLDDEDRAWFIYVLGWLTTGRENTVVNPKLPEWGFADDATTFTLADLAARIPTAEAIAAAVVAKLPQGSVDVAAVVAGVRAVLAEVRVHVGGPVELAGHLELADPVA